MKKLYEVVVDQRSVVFDKIVYIVEAENMGEAIAKCQSGDYEDIAHSEELDRDWQETYWNEAHVDDLDEKTKRIEELNRQFKEAI
jgi:hypothetical protein